MSRLIIQNVTFIFCNYPKIVNERFVAVELIFPNNLNNFKIDFKIILTVETYKLLLDIKVIGADIENETNASING